MLKQETLFSPCQNVTWGCWSKLQGSTCLPSPGMWLEQLRGTWGLDKTIPVAVNSHGPGGKALSA